jgi:hypothetical protein
MFLIFLFCAVLSSDKNAVRGTHYKIYHKILKDGYSLAMKEITDKERKPSLQPLLIPCVVTQAKR